MSAILLNRNLTQYIVVGTAVVLMVTVLALTRWLGVPPLIMAALSWSCISALLPGTISSNASGSLRRYYHLTGWIASMVCWGQLLLGNHTSDPLYGVIGWIVALILLLAALIRRPGDRSGMQIRLLAVIWAFCGTACGLIFAYAQNRPLAFLVALALMAGLLVLCKCWFKMSAWSVICVNTLILLLVGIPVVDFILAPSDHLDAPPPLSARPYAYASAKRDPAAHVRWWKYYLDEGVKLYARIFQPDPEGVLPFYLKPATKAKFCESEISINKLGYRGREISIKKGNAVRIVALGESTTWGATLAADDEPWPRKLEKLLRERIRPSQSVEVINAGVPSITLAENIVRLERSILALKPDIIVSYHGYNGFPWLDASLPAIRTSKPPPRYHRRPLKLLADCEYRVRLLKFTHQDKLTGKDDKSEHAPLDPLKSEYARYYEELIKITRTNGIPLVVATYSMAVNGTSARDVAGFYQHFIPTLQRQVKANEMHTVMLKALARKHPEVILVDTQPRLDGRYEYFIDLMHFTEEGRKIIAELFFEAIKPVLETHRRLNSATALRKE